MLFNTHNRTPKVITNKTLKIMLICCYSLVGAFFLVFAIVTSIAIHSITPALVILIPVVSLVIFFIVTTTDMNKAYIKIDGNTITVVDYYFFVKKERVFLINQIKKAEIALGYSLKVHGYRHSMMGFTYIVFKDENNKYLFKVINCPKSNEYFSKYFEITSI